MSSQGSDSQDAGATLQGGERELPSLPLRLDRRFEALVLWSTSTTVSRSTARAVVDLCEAGAMVGWLAPAPVHELAERLGRPSAGAARLILADSRATVHLADGPGTERFGTVQREEDPAVVERAGAAVSEALRARGVSTTVILRPENSPGVIVELLSDSQRTLTPARFERFLLAHGIEGEQDLAELAAEAARRVGLDDPRVKVEDNTIEIALFDAGDVVLGMLADLWRRGVDPQGVLLLVDGSPGVARRSAPVIDPDSPAATVVVLDSGRSSPVPGAVSLPGGRNQLHRLLSDQLRRRRERALPEPPTRAGWSLVVDDPDVETEAVHEALLTLADGRVGISGARLARDRHRRPWVVAAGVYDGIGPSTHLLTGPVTFGVDGTIGHGVLRRVLDLRTGVLYERAGAGEDAMQSARFLSLARPTTAVLRVGCTKAFSPGSPLLGPVAAEAADFGRVGDISYVRVSGSGGGIVAAACQDHTGGQSTTNGCEQDDRVLDRVAVYGADPDAPPDPAPVVDAARRAALLGFDRLLAEHREAWALRWEDADVVVEGDDELQLGIRFALFNLMASVGDTGETAVGARGLTGTGYSGHVFWDADTFVLPFLAATHPASARAMLEYRLRRLPTAIEAALAVGRRGARFPWESAQTGHDVTPTSARDRSGRVVPIRTGQLEEHIVAQVAWAACCYMDWSGDEEFTRGPGSRILVETARYWASRIRVEKDGDAHIYGVIGPDEYHEPVDDNAFTNVMARWNMRRAAEAVEEHGADVDVDVIEREQWLELATALDDGYDPDTGVYEQFAGFSRLEPLVIAELAPRRPIAADLFLGAERTRGAQVIKQPDVLMLHHLVPDEVVPGSLEPNLRYYEPRTSHGSSLSPAIYASVLARARDFDRALQLLHIAARMDLDDLTGSTAQGLHVATMGGLWQALAFGFAGLRARNGVLQIDPVLPPSWSALELRVRFHGSQVRVRKERAQLSVTVDRQISVVVHGASYELEPGTRLFHRSGPDWALVS